MSSENNDKRPACAVCRIQRHSCPPDCTMAPFFPHTMSVDDMKIIRDTFGVKNACSIITNITDVTKKGYAAASIKWTAMAWGRDRVFGPYGLFLKLMNNNKILANRLAHQEEQIQFLTTRLQQQLTIHTDPTMYCQTGLAENIDWQINHMNGNNIEHYNMVNREVNNQSNCSDINANANNVAPPIGGNGQVVGNGGMITENYALSGYRMEQMASSRANIGLNQASTSVYAHRAGHGESSGTRSNYINIQDVYNHPGKYDQVLQPHPHCSRLMTTPDQFMPYNLQQNVVENDGRQRVFHGNSDGFNNNTNLESGYGLHGRGNENGQTSVDGNVNDNVYSHQRKTTSNDNRPVNGAGVSINQTINGRGQGIQNNSAVEVSNGMTSFENYIPLSVTQRGSGNINVQIMTAYNTNFAPTPPQVFSQQESNPVDIDAVIFNPPGPQEDSMP